MRQTKRSFLQHIITANLGAVALFLGPSASQAKENVFEAVPLGTPALTSALPEVARDFTSEARILAEGGRR
jgi:hypothetical protein